MEPLQKVSPHKQITGADYNRLVDKINMAQILSTDGIKRIQTPRGVHLINNSGVSSSSLRVLYVLEVVSLATAKGFYNCQIESYDADYWSSNTDGFTDVPLTFTGSSDLSFADNNPANDTVTYAGENVGFVTTGFLPGTSLIVTGTTFNNRTVVIESVTETVITLDSTGFFLSEANQSATLTGTFLVQNMTEVGTTTTHALVPGDRLMCWYFNDDVSTSHFMGRSMESDIRLAITQEAAQADLNIRVKLCNRAGTAVGSAFDCLLMETDDATAATSALPRIGITEKVLVWKAPSGVWYVVNPTIIKSSVCA